jgi:hypothetical protein
MKDEHLDETNGAHNDPRAREIDDALSYALRAEDPGAAFTQRVLARAREERAAQQSGRPLNAAAFGQTTSTASEVSTRPSSDRSEVSGRTEVSARQAAEVLAMPSSEVSARPPHARAHRFTATRKLIAAIAASLTLAAAGTQWMQHRRYVAEGERARAQVLAALRLTNEKLNFVHEKITEREQAR